MELEAGEGQGQPQKQFSPTAGTHEHTLWHQYCARCWGDMMVSKTKRLFSKTLPSTEVWETDRQQNQTKQGVFSTAKHEDERRQGAESGEWALQTEGQGGTLRGWPWGWDPDVEEERTWRLLEEGTAMQRSRGECEEAHTRPERSGRGMKKGRGRGKGQVARAGALSAKIQTKIWTKERERDNMKKNHTESQSWRRPAAQQAVCQSHKNRIYMSEGAECGFNSTVMGKALREQDSRKMSHWGTRGKLSCHASICWFSSCKVFKSFKLKDELYNFLLKS